MLYNADFYKKFDSIQLVLGRNCNNTCKHCIHSNVLSSSKVVLDGKIYLFLKDWVSVNKNINKRRRLGVIGGEPLLYWNDIKNIIQELYSIDDKVRFEFTTNGILLTEDKVDFLNKYNVLVSLSFEGPNETYLRPIIPSKKSLDCFLKLKRRLIKSSISVGNPNILDSYLYLSEKFSDTPVIVHFLSDLGFDGITDFEPEHIYTEVIRMIGYILGNIDNPLLGPMHKYLLTPAKVTPIYNDFYDNFFCNYPGRLTLNYDGGVLKCNSFDTYNVKIGDSEEDILKFQKRKFTEKDMVIPENCKICSYYYWCRRGCALSSFSKDGKELSSCKYMKEYYRACIDTGFFEVPVQRTEYL